MSYLTSIHSIILLSSAVLIVGNITANNSTTETQREAASRRSLLSLAEVIRTYTGRRARDYNNYGCFCGWKGKGTPVDEVDRCCQEHDRCYKGTGCFLNILVVPVKQSCDGGSCQCNDNYESCAYNACTCDVQFGECIRSATYREENKGRC